MEGAPPELVSPGGDLAYTIVNVPAETPDGLEVYVTGGLGFNADFEEVFGDIDGGRRG